MPWKRTAQDLPRTNTNNQSPKQPVTLGSTKKAGTEVRRLGNSLAVQWLRLCTSTSRGTGLLPGQGTKILQAVRHGQKINKT